jgi:hypothetical protein
LSGILTTGKLVLESVADPGSEFFPSRIPGQKDSRIRMKEFKYFNPKIVSKLRILIFYPSRIPDPRVKKALEPGSGSATLLLDVKDIKVE